MAKSRDEIRDRLNQALQDAETKKQQLDVLIQQYKQEKESLKSETETLITILKSEFKTETQQELDDLNSKNAILESKIAELEAEKNSLSKDKDTLLTEIKSEGTKTIAAIKKQIEDNHEEVKKSWLDQLMSWSRKEQSNKSKSLDDIILKETGKAANIIEQDVLSQESRKLANAKGDIVKTAERNILIALALMILLGIGIFLYYALPSQKFDFWSVIFKGVFLLPIGFYIWLQTSKIKRETCLRDNYHHKQLVMASYSAFMNIMKDNKQFTPEKQVQMTEHLFIEVRDNAADKADKHEITKLKIRNKLLSDVIKEIPKVAKQLNTQQLKDLLNKLETQGTDGEKAGSE